jgi:MoaA/NifB/PqqE/SkfB family radical SAM enzyme
VNPRKVTILWALRSRCKMSCRYCYFGEEATDQLGVLSHASRNDLTATQVLAFAGTMGGSDVERVVLAGGDPLDWPHTLPLIRVLKAAGVEVVVATDGIALNRPPVLQGLLDAGVDGLSVSLDSIDPDGNDEYRTSRSGKFGHADVLAGIRAVLATRTTGARPRVGIYTVVHRRNVPQVTALAQLADDLGADYYVPQPISLSPNHPLDAELTPTPEDTVAIAEQLASLYTGGYRVALPDASYARKFVAAIASRSPGMAGDCFGGSELFFIQPDGTWWDCPSDLRIAATPPQRQRSIAGADVKDLLRGRPPCADCSLFGRDCVSMWPLTGDLGRFMNPDPMAGAR